MLKTIRKSLLYKTEVEYGDYTINHIEGCSHGCMYPCYAMMMSKRFGRVKTYNEWIKPKIVENSEELLKKEIEKYKTDIKYVHFCFSTDPFMYDYNEISSLTIKLISILNKENIRCTALTKGLLPIELNELSKKNEFGITLVSLDESFREKYEPYSAPYIERIQHLFNLHKKGIKTWVSIEPYPTPNIIRQNLITILNSIGFVNKIIFGKLNYNKMVTMYPEYKNFFNEKCEEIQRFSEKNHIEYYIKNGTLTEDGKINPTRKMPFEETKKLAEAF
jgi:DNA repair photolyase